jgi:hypothetical protein
MQTNLDGQKDYTQTFYVLFYTQPELIEAAKTNNYVYPWLFVKKYADRQGAENGLKKQKEKHGNYVYKIVRYTITAQTIGE